MTKINVSPDCGNSPKNLFLQQVTIAFATGDINAVLEAVADDVSLEIIGQETGQGKGDLARLLKRLTQKTLQELTICHAVTHGKAGAVNGVAKYNHKKTLSFCNAYEFTGAKGDCVKTITTYWIETA